MVEVGTVSVLDGRWRGEVCLKRDVFSTIERGYFRTQDGEVEAVLRRIDGVPWWSKPLAYLLFRQERRASGVPPCSRLGHGFCSPNAACWCGAGSPACRCTSPSRTATSAI